MSTVSASSPSSTLARNSIAGGVLVWLLGMVVAAANGLLGSMSPFAPPPIAAATVVVWMSLYWSLPGFRRYIANVGLRRLTLVHGLRILAVPLFFWYGAHGLLPRVFAERAGWGDLAAGVVALAVAAWWPKVTGYWFAHVLGMIDFLIAFGTAIRLSMHDPMAVHAVTRLPMALIPFFGVGFLATTHVMAYDLLLRGGASETKRGYGMVSASNARTSASAKGEA